LVNSFNGLRNICVLKLERNSSFELFIIFWRCLGISKENQINEEIRDKEVRVISADGEQVGVMSAKEALSLAEKSNLDLVKIAPNAVPPVCKIMDYGKFKFEQAKREKEAKKKQKVMDIKEVRLSLNIDTGDFNTKVNHALRFLKDGDKVKVSIRFRGREMAHTDNGIVIMQRFADACSEIGSVEKPAKLEGRSMLMFLVPKASK
jgi:translation initiation factor IF-3